MANPSAKRPYEEQWRQAFEDAEMSPSPDVWKNIDQQLTAQEGGKYKRGFFFYRAVAAVLLLCIAGLGWYIVGQRETENIAQRTNSATESTTTEMPNGTADTTPEATIAQRDPSATTQPSVTDTPSILEDSQPGASNGRRVRRKQAAEETLAVLDPPLAGEKASVSSQENSAADNSTSALKTLIFPNEGVSKGEAELHSISHRVGRLAALSPDALDLTSPVWIDSIEQLFLVPQYREESTFKEEDQGVQFFAGLAMAPSLFDPNFQSQGHPMNAFVLDGPNSEYNNLDNEFLEAFSDASVVSRNNAGTVTRTGLDNRSTLSFSYGFDVGLSLGEHWSIESGLDYQNFQTSTETNLTVVDVQTGERYPLLAANAYTSRATYANTTPINDAEEVTNNFQFVSVPLKLGYNMKFSKITVSVSPGIAANFFLENRISSERYAQTVITDEGSSPFNSRYLSALVSGGVFYQLLENYSVSFTPSYQFALSELTKTSATFSSLPQSFGLKLGVRYNFR